MDDPPCVFIENQVSLFAANPLQVTSSAAVLIIRLPFIIFTLHKYDVLIVGLRLQNIWCQVSGFGCQA